KRQQLQADKAQQAEDGGPGPTGRRSVAANGGQEERHCGRGEGDGGGDAEGGGLHGSEGPGCRNGQNEERPEREGSRSEFPVVSCESHAPQSVTAPHSKLKTQNSQLTGSQLRTDDCPAHFG